MRWAFSRLKQKVWEVFTEATFESRFEVSEVASNADTWANSIPGRQNSTSKGPEAETCLACLRNSKEASAAGMIEDQRSR